jgi:hypothetical protein
MSTAAPAERNRTVARRWIDAFNARDTEAEARARTPGHVAHAPESIQPAPLDGDAWTGFLASMVARRILFTGTHTGPFQGLPPTGRRVRFCGLERGCCRGRA